ncbi:MAG: HDOD domain-containing protein [Thermodesulfovibrionales bacterium]
MNNTLRLLVQRIPKLPTLPSIAREILMLIDNDSLSIDRLEDVLDRDPSISSKVLGLSNSAFFRPDKPISTIRDAIFRIGFKNVKTIALSVSLLTLLKDEGTSSVIDYQMVFRHSFSVGMVSKSLSDILRLPISEASFTSGLLHDLGILVLNAYFPNYYQKVIDDIREGNFITDSELKILGFTHAEIGAWLADKWNLPIAIKDVILYHHNISGAKRFLDMIAIVHISDFITCKNIPSLMNREGIYRFDPLSLEVLKITEKQLVEIESSLDKSIFSQDG